MKSKKILLLLSVNVIVFCAACRILPVLYEDNDDISMAWIASGTYSGTPDCHLEYINAIYGKVLNLFYSVVPSVEWYSVFFGAFQILSVSIILSYAIRLFRGRKVPMVSVVFFVYCLWMWIIARYQFTTTAAVLAFASVLLLLDRRFVSGGFLLVIAGMIRFSAAGLVGLIMAPAFLYYYGKDLGRWVPLAAVLFVTVTVHCCDTLFYLSEDWKAYREFDSYRGKINDNPNLWRLKDHLPEGVDEINYRMVESFFADPAAISAGQLKTVVDYLHHDIPLRKRAKNVVPGCWNHYWIWFLFVAVTIVPAFLIKGDKKVAFLAAAGFAVWLMSLSVLSFDHSVKNRVFTSSFIAVSFYPVLTLSCLSKEKRGPLVAVLCSMLSLFGIYEYAVPAFTRFRALKTKAETIECQMRMVSQYPGYSIVSNGPDFAVEMLPPFALSRCMAPNVFINPYCYMGSPLNNDPLSSHRNLLRDDVLMMAVDGNDDSRELLNAIYHNYGVRADTVHVAEIGKSMLLKIVPVKE